MQPSCSFEEDKRPGETDVSSPARNTRYTRPTADNHRVSPPLYNVYPIFKSFRRDFKTIFIDHIYFERKLSCFTTFQSGAAIFNSVCQILICFVSLSTDFKYPSFLLDGCASVKALSASSDRIPGRQAGRRERVYRKV